MSRWTEGAESEGEKKPEKMTRREGEEVKWKSMEKSGGFGSTVVSHSFSNQMVSTPILY